ncbi:methyl-accepting chemotaxis protein [Brassicibacter mesophilus]|uniref:methyl-accepting chemotaxis protein n=1 Tax=Brassicibacter mesophilus TaxID=745119 RepID=UPI003D1A67D4
MIFNRKKYEIIIEKLISGDFEVAEAEMSKDHIINKLLELSTKISTNKEDVKYIMNAVLDIAVEISAFDVKLNHYSNDIINTTDELSEVTDTMLGVFEEISASMSELEHNSNEFAGNLSRISDDSEELKKNTMSSNEMVAKILKEIEFVSGISGSMYNDVEGLIEATDKVSKVLANINQIAEQINILALNASIEAARAGEHGKGFTVVAEEVRKLSNSTKQMLDSLNASIDDINSASRKSSHSVTQSVNEVNKVRDQLHGLSEIFNKNTQVIENTAEKLNSIADTSNELSSATEQISVAMNDTTHIAEKVNSISMILTSIAQDINKTATSIEKVEEKVDHAAKISGRLGTDTFYRVTNQEFINTIKPAIVAHKNWVNVLSNMVNNMKVSPLQTDGHRCAFGHFYHSVKPQHAEILEVWNSVDSYHEELHRIGSIVIDLIKKNDQREAKIYVDKAKEISETIISMFSQMIDIAIKLNEKGEYVL